MRQLLAGTIIGLSLLVATISWTGFVMLRTTLNTDRSQEVAEALIENEAVQDFISDEIAAELSETVPEVSILGSDLLNELASDAVEDEKVQQAIALQLAGYHKRLIDGNDENEIALDSVELGNAGREYLVGDNTALDGIIPQDLLLPVSLPTTGLGFIPTLKSVLDSFVTLGLVASTFGVLIGFIIAPNRRKILRRLSRWAIGAAVFWIAIGVGIPWVLGQVGTDSTALLSALVSALFKPMRIPAILMTILAIGLFIASRTWPDSSSKSRKEKDKPKKIRAPRDKPDSQRPTPYRKPYLDDRDDPRYRDTSLPQRDQWERR